MEKWVNRGSYERAKAVLDHAQGSSTNVQMPRTSLFFVSADFLIIVPYIAEH